jgi:O-antigen ligase
MRCADGGTFGSRIRAQLVVADDATKARRGFPTGALPLARDGRVPPIRSQERSSVVQDFGFVALALCGMLFVLIGRAGEVIPGASDLPLAKIAVALVVLGAFVGRQRLSKVAFSSSPMARTSLVFFALGALSVLFSIWKANSLNFVLTTLLVLATVFVLVFKVATSWRIVQGTMLALCASAVALAIPATLGYRGERVEVGLTYDTNDLAFVLVTVTPIALAFAFVRSGWRRWMFAAMCGICLWAMLLTESRGGLLGLIAGVLAFLLWKPALPGGQRVRAVGGVWRRLIWTLAAVFVAVLVWTILPSQARERFSTMLDIESDYNMQEQSVGRTFIWKRNMIAVAQRPVGYGIASAGALNLQFSGRYQTAHNSVVQVATELGILGMILFLRLYWLAWSGLGRLRYAIAPDPNQPQLISGADAPMLLHGLRAALVASFVAGFFLSQGFSYLLFTLFALCAALFALHPDKSVSRFAGRPKLRAGQATAAP